MTTRTRQYTIKTMAIIIILASLPTLGTAQTDDPNAPWDGSDLLAAVWESVTRSITTYNPIEWPDIAPLTRTSSITVSGDAYILDANDLIAVATTHATALQAFDQDGNEVFFDPNAVIQEPGRTWILGQTPKAFSIELPLDLDQACPTLLSQLDFTVEALYGQPFTTVMVPLEVTEEWMELAPRYHIRVRQAEMVDNVCHILIEEENVGNNGFDTRSFDPNDGPWVERVSPSGRVHKLSDSDLVVDLEIVDADGNPFSGGGRTTYTMHGSTEVNTATYQRELRNCPGIEGLFARYTFAIGIYETPIRLTLTDIPVPGL